MICDDLSYFPNLAIIVKRFFHQIDARIASCYGEFSARKNKSRTIIEDDTDLFAIDLAGVPIKVNRSKPVLSFISNPGFSAFLLFLVLFGQTIFKKNLMDCIVRYMPAVFMIEELINFIQIGLGTSEFFGANGSLFFIQCPQTLLTVRILTFISIDIFLELMLLVLDRIMYLTLAGDSFKTLFLLPLPIPYRSGRVYKCQAFRTLQVHFLILN